MFYILLETHNIIAFKYVRQHKQIGNWIEALY